MKVAILADFPLHIIPEFGESFRAKGHYATWLPQLAEEFGKIDELEAHWIVLSAQIPSAKCVIWKNQHFHILPTAQRYRAGTVFWRDRAAIARTIHEIRPDIVHGWGTEDVYALAAVSSGFQNIVSMQGILSHIMLKTMRRPREYFQGLLELYVLKCAKTVTVESDWGRARVARRNANAKIEIVEYGVQPHFFEVPWRPNPQKPVVLYVGSLTSNKGIQDLIAAYRSTKLAGTELWVVGDGRRQWVNRLRRIATSNVFWLGRKPTTEIAALLGQTWCLALPTRADTSPNVVKEARVVGLPVITTPCGGQASYIEDGKNGFLVKPGEIDKLTERLSLILGDLSVAQKMGAYRQSEHRAWFQPANTAQRFWQLYNQVVFK